MEKKEENQENRLALEILKELKTNAKRWFIAFVVVLVMLFATNCLWLYAWCLPVEEVLYTTEVTQTSEENGTNNYIGRDGDITNGYEANCEDN